MMLNSIKNLFCRYSTLIACVGFVLCFESLFSIEWTLPYCNHPSDGMMSAVFGMPFPYFRWNQASSLHYNVMPHVYVLNLVLMSSLLYLLLRYILKKFLNVYKNQIQRFFTFLALVLILISLILKLPNLFVNTYHPLFSIGDAYGHYSELRPLAIKFYHPQTECSPSEYWFPKEIKNSLNLFNEQIKKSFNHIKL